MRLVLPIHSFAAADPFGIQRRGIDCRWFVDVDDDGVLPYPITVSVGVP